MDIGVGDRIWFVEERRPYTVRARSDRYLVCTKPFAARNTVIYTVVDLQEKVRGTENLIFGAGAESDEDCRQMVDRLEGRGCEWATEVSYRNRVPLHINKRTTPVLREIIEL